MRRLIQAADVLPLGINRPIGHPRTELMREDGVRKAVRVNYPRD
jgi:hypothetical protein